MHREEGWKGPLRPAERMWGALGSQEHMALASVRGHRVVPCHGSWMLPLPVPTAAVMHTPWCAKG